MTRLPLRLLLLSALVVGAWAPAPARHAGQPKPAAARAMPAQPALAQAASPAGLLQADGTLRLDGQFNGSLNLQGWDVRLDPKRGPVFDPTGGGGDPLPSGQWASLGGGASALNGPVTALVVSGTTVYAGGAFIDADSRGHGADHLVKWDGSAWSAVDPNVLFNGSIYALAVAGNGLYVGGDFTSVQGVGGPVAGTAYVAGWNGTSWSGLGGDGAGGSSLNGAVNAMAIIGTGLYVGGAFLQVKDHSTTPLAGAAYVARWGADTSHWSALSHGATPSAASLSGSALALAVSGSDLYVGGNFLNVNNHGTPLAAADYLAKWNGVDWSALGQSNTGDGALNGAVDALAVDGSGNLYVGGAFMNVALAHFPWSLPSADYIAKWDGDWHPLGTGVSPSFGALGGPVAALVVSGTTVYAGGQFADVRNGSTVLGAADFVAQWDGAAWSALGSDGAGQGALRGNVLALAADGAGHLYVGSTSNRASDNGNMLGNAAYLAEWTGADWAALTDQPNGAINTDYGVVEAVVVSGTDVYVGGDFQDVHDGPNILTAADYVARWDGLHWSALGSNGTGDGALNGPVYALVVSGTTLYAGGLFTNVNNDATADYVARWDGAHWSSLGSNGAGGGALDNGVYALALSGHSLYVGGLFTAVNDGLSPLPAAAYIAQWDTNAGHWSALGHGATAAWPALNSAVTSIAVTGTVVYVGGEFSDVNDSGTALPAADYVAKWDTQAGHWSALGQGAAGNGALNNYALALAVIGNDLYVGGLFGLVNNHGTPLPAARFIARWDANTGDWSALGNNGAGSGALNGSVLALGVAGDDLYVGGQFTDVNDSGNALPTADYVARWDGTHWSALGSDGAGNGALNRYVMAGFGNDYVDALVIQSQNLYAGGQFFDVSNNGTPLPEADNIAAYGIGHALYLPLVRR